MIIKIFLLLLIGIAVVGMVGRWKTGRRGQKSARRKCPDCGRPQIGKGPCGCRISG